MEQLELDLTFSRKDKSIILLTGSREALYCGNCNTTFGLTRILKDATKEYDTIEHRCDGIYHYMRRISDNKLLFTMANRFRETM